MLAIVNVTIVKEDYLIPDGVILVENGRIFDFGRKLRVPEGAEIIDGGGNFAGPGLIDIHTHADGKYYFYENPESCSETLLDHGVTSVMPALYYNMNKEQYLKAIDVIDGAVKEGKFENFLGYYMEGPYLNPKFGCDRENNPWKGDIDGKDYEEILDKVTNTAKVWCLSPEREGTLEFAKSVKAKIPNIVFSVAHSESTPEKIEELMPYGLKLGTHHTNATGTLENYPECRGVCVDETVNYHNDIYAELICDSMGIHVHPYMLRLVRKIKGDERIILISDACVFDGPPIPGCEEAFDINFDDNGEIAGSKMTLDIACGNMIKHTGCSVCDAFRFASGNPARLLGLCDMGAVKKGNIANIIIVDNWFKVKNTILKGEIVK
ncbi:MAG: amidohydrolase family protein [Clostridia bacterium]|nr:amidohydrolase family protein [Clostridia bacterium]